MTETEQKMLRELLADRQAVALNRLKDETRYIEVCEAHDKQGEAAEALLQRLEKEERLIIRRYYEDEQYQIHLELEAVYLQGLRDSMKILAFMGAFNVGMSIQ